MLQFELTSITIHLDFALEIAVLLLLDLALMEQKETLFTIIVLTRLDSLILMALGLLE